MFLIVIKKNWNSYSRCLEFGGHFSGHAIIAPVYHVKLVRIDQARRDFRCIRVAEILLVIVATAYVNVIERKKNS